MESNEKIDFVTLELTRDLVHTNRSIINENNGKKYVPISGPEGGQFFYPIDSLKQDAKDPNKIYITRPEGTEFRIFVSNDKEPQIYRIEELKAAYEAKNFVNFSVPTAWAKEFTSKEGKNCISLSVPVPEDNEKNYYSFVISANNFRPSKTEGMSYFGLPRKMPESNEDYNVKMTRSVKVGDDYQQEVKYCTSTQLKILVEKAVEKYRMSNMFVNVAISEKLVKPFTSKNGTELYDITLPIPTNDKTQYYSFVLEGNRVKQLEDGKVLLSMYRNNKDGEPYTINAEMSIKNSADEYEKISHTFTSEEIADIYTESSKRYKEEHSFNTVDFADKAENNPFLNIPVLDASQDSQEAVQQPQMHRRGR